MVIIKRILLGIVALLVLFFVVGFLLPRDVRVERSVEIDASPQAVFTMVNDFQQFNRWQPWAQIDPTTRYVYEGPATGAGSRMTWYSDHPQVGDGMQEITLSEPYSRVRMALDFGTGGLANADYLIDAGGAGGSILTWTLETDMGGNPVARYVGLMMDGMVGPAYEQGLANLKEILENQPRQEPGPAIMDVPGDPDDSGAAQPESLAT
ncbi:MAG: SRPBCC family protein [Gammaproteobacteria bacterium]|nr:SRPBCC family protein [Chromatiales bacterium]MYE48265.1 SRPBCC family protein [Gammaproteobacteria bacterium]